MLYPPSLVSCEYLLSGFEILYPFYVLFLGKFEDVFYLLRSIQDPRRFLITHQSD